VRTRYPSVAPDVQSKEDSMARCEICGNDYPKSFEIVMAETTHVFDSFECAIHALAPSCAHCGCRIIGHGVETDMTIYCCARCARAAESAAEGVSASVR